VTRNRAGGLLLLVALGAGGVTLVAGRAAAAAHASAARADEARRRDADIRFYAARVAADPIGAADRARLASLYLQQARETGDFAGYRRAEALARQSLVLRAAHNAQASGILAVALLAQHRFTEALGVARALDARDPGDPNHQALVAEIELELGQYDRAGALFDSLWPQRYQLAIAPRLARWAEIRGDTATARRLLDRALAAAEQRRDLPAEQLAWFYLRVGDLALRYGRLERAAYALRQGLTIRPADYRLLGALTRLAAARGRWREAIAYGDEAIAVVPDPATFGVIGDAYAALGDTARAAEYARAMEVAVLGQPGQWHRAWSLFLLDHHRRVPEVLARVREELRTRRDVYGYDLLAWALHRAGRDAEARVAMQRALAWGTRDPQLLRHAAAIGGAL
jgi:tetratricopeptide (TPR) repeat protein